MLVRQVPGSQPSLIPLASAAVTVGRDAREVDFSINTSDDKNVISRCHARLLRVPQPDATPPLYRIVSLGTNGLSVNGQRRSEWLLQDGDEVVFAPSHRPQELLYRFHSTPQSAFAAAAARTNAATQPSGPPPPPVRAALERSEQAVTPTAAAYAGMPATASTNGNSAMPASHNGFTTAGQYSAMPADESTTSPPQPPSAELATTSEAAMNYDRMDDADLDYSRYLLHSTATPPTLAANLYSAMPAQSAAVYAPLTHSAMQSPSASPPPPPPLRHQTTTPLSPTPTPTPTPSFSSATWNDRFQSALDLPESTPEAALHKYSQLSALSSDFVSLAKLYGRTIIEEYFLQPQQRSIAQSSGLGGLAGGRKYVVRGILFKLASDVQIGAGRWLYGGEQCEYESANKVGSHELKSAIRFFPFHASGLRVPMLALVEYLGYRLLAMPIMPLPSSSPPLLGSSDAGRTVHASDEQLVSLVRSAASELHLAAHTVSGVEMHTAGDVEGHKGDDGRYYILDLARSFPPEQPSRSTQPQAALYRLLRPELLQLLKAEGTPALSSDAYTRWGAEAAEMHNARVDEATRLLHERYLPALARKWMLSEKSEVDRLLADDTEAEQNGEMRGQSSQPATFAPDEELSVEGMDIRFLRLSEELHCHGLNMRSLGLLRHHILTEYAGSPHTANVGLLLLVEAVSRTLKSLLRARLRACVERVTSGSTNAEYDCVRCVVDFFNLVTASASRGQSDSFWHTELEAALRQRFDDRCLQPHESTRLFALVSPHLLRVLSYLCLACGVALSPACEDSLSSGAVQYVFTVVDVELRVQSRSMAIIDYAEARVMQAQAAVYAQKAEAADSRAKRAASKGSKRTANGRHKTHPVTEPILSDAAATAATSAHLRSTVTRLLSLAVQIYERLRHSDPFNSSYKRQARQCKQQLRQMQEQCASLDDSSSQPDSLQPASLLPLSQSSLSSLHPPHSSATARQQHSSQHQPLLSQTIRTGLSTAFQRFALQPAIASQPIARNGSSLNGHLPGAAESQQWLLSSQHSNASLLFSLTPPAPSASQVPHTPTSTASVVAPPPVSSIQPASLARALAMAGSLSTLAEQNRSDPDSTGRAEMEWQAAASEEQAEEQQSEGAGAPGSTLAASTQRGAARGGAERRREGKRPTAAVRTRLIEAESDCKHSLAVTRPRRTATRNAAKSEEERDGMVGGRKSGAPHEKMLTPPRKRRR